MSGKNCNPCCSNLEYVHIHRATVFVAFGCQLDQNIVSVLL